MLFTTNHFFGNNFLFAIRMNTAFKLNIQIFKKVPVIICPCLIIFFITFLSCESRKKKQGDSLTMVMTAELVNDSNVFRMYDSLHSKKGIWPAILKANLASGIEQVRIYRFGNRLMMMVEMPAGTDLEKMNSLYVNADEKVKEWGKLIDSLQKSLPGVDSTKKWVEMKLIHHYRDGQYIE